MNRIITIGLGITGAAVASALFLDTVLDAADHASSIQPVTTLTVSCTYSANSSVSANGSAVNASARMVCTDGSVRPATVTDVPTTHVPTAAPIAHPDAVMVDVVGLSDTRAYGTLIKLGYTVDRSDCATATTPVRRVTVGGEAVVIGHGYATHSDISPVTLWCTAIS